MGKYNSPIHTEYGERMAKYFFEGFTVKDYFERSVFPRLSNYLHHGLCYEVSALNMLIWHGHKSRMVYGSCKVRGVKGRMKHCWIEVKYDGIWYVIDQSWFQAIIPKTIYYTFLLVKIDRKVKYKEFWNMSVSKELYERIKQPETAYIFWFLFLDRRITEDEKKLIIEGFPDLVIGDSTNVMPLDAYSDKNGVKHPLSHEILRDFVLHEKIKMPRRRMVSRAARFAKLMNKAQKDIRENYDGKNVEVYVSMEGYEIKEVMSS